MKKRGVEKLIKNEISTSSRFDVSAITGVTYAKPSFPIKRVMAFAMSFILIVGLFALIPFVNKTSSAVGGTIVIDVNPSIEIKYDAKGKVTEINGLNGDGKILLTNVSLIGKSYENAVDEIVSQSKALGYFSSERETNAVLISVTDDKNKVSEKVERKIEQRFDKAFEQNSLFGVVIIGDNSGESVNGITAQRLSLMDKIVQLTPEDDKQEDYHGKTVSQLYELLEQTEKTDLNSRLKQSLENVLNVSENEPFKNGVQRFLQALNDNRVEDGDINGFMGDITRLPPEEKELYSDLYLLICEYNYVWKMENKRDEMYFEMKDKGGMDQKPPAPPDEDRQNELKRDFSNNWFGMQEDWRRNLYA